MALGNAKHRRQVFDLYHDIKQSLADCLFAFAAQSGLPKSDTLRLLEHLSKVKPGEADASGVVDNTTLTLTLALLYSFDVSALNKREDGEEVLQNMFLVKDASFIPALHKELGPSSTKTWANPALQVGEYVLHVFH